MCFLFDIFVIQIKRIFIVLRKSVCMKKKKKLAKKRFFKILIKIDKPMYKNFFF
jgi:hypothetical protein